MADDVSHIRCSIDRSTTTGYWLAMCECGWHSGWLPWPHDAGSAAMAHAREWAIAEMEIDRLGTEHETDGG